MSSHLTKTAITELAKKKKMMKILPNLLKINAIIYL